MADVIFLSERRAPAAYRLYGVGPAGRQGAGRILKAKSDVEAKTLALSLLGDVPLELWNGDYFIARYWPGGLPEALSVSVITDSDIRCLSIKENKIMANEKKHGNRETKKPKKAIPNVIAAAPSTKNAVSAIVKPAVR